MEINIDVDSIIARLLDVRGSRPGKQVNLQEQEIKGLCIKAREIFCSQPVLLELEAPIKICDGTLHQKYEEIAKMRGRPNLNTMHRGGQPKQDNDQQRFTGPYVAKALLGKLPAAQSGQFLELGSGSGQLITFIASAHRDAVAAAASGDEFAVGVDSPYTFQPSDRVAWSPKSCDVYRTETGGDAPSGGSVQEAKTIDYTAPHEQWSGVAARQYDAVLLNNVFEQLADDAQTANVLAGAARVLKPSGVLLAYGPFTVEDKPMTAVNVQRQAALVASNPKFAIRSLASVVAAAAAAGFKHKETVCILQSPNTDVCIIATDRQRVGKYWECNNWLVTFTRA